MAKINANIAMYQKKAPIPLVQCSSCQHFTAASKGKLAKCAIVEVTPTPTASCVLFAPKSPVPLPPMLPLPPMKGLTTGTEAWNKTNIRHNIF